MSDNASLTYELDAQIGKFKDAFDSATKTAASSFDQVTSAGRDAASKIESSIGSAVSSINNAFESLKNPAKSTGDMIGALIGGGLIAAAAGFTTIMGELVNALSDAGDRADDLRLPINMLQALKLAADEARVPTDKLNGALDKFTEVSKKSADDAKSFYAALNQIGASFSKAFQQAPTQAERLRVIMSAMAATTDEVKRAQLAQEAFGSDNERLIGMFSGGRDAMEAYIQQMRTLGLEIDESAVKRAQEAKSALSALAMVMTDELSSALADLIPSFKEFLPYLEKVAGYVRDTLADYASPENRPLATLKSDAAAAQQQIADLQAHLKSLDDYKPATGLLGAVGNKTGLDIETAQDKGGKFAGIGVDIAADRKRTEEELARLQGDVAKYNDLIAQKEKQQKPKGADDGTEQPAFKPRPSLSKDDDGSKAFDKAVSSANKHAASMEADAAAVGLNTTAHQQLRAEVSLLEAAQKSGDAITQQQIDSYAKLRATMSEQQALAAAGISLTSAQAAAFDQVSTHVKTAATALQSAQKQFEGINSALSFAGNQFISIFDQATQKSTSFQQIMQNVLKQVEQQLLQVAILGQGAFAKLIPGVSSNNGGVGGLMGALAGLFGGAHASGGDIDPNKIALVGERGPELIVPKRPSTVIPNHQLAIGGGSRNQVVNNHQVNISVTGATGSHQDNQDMAERIGKQVQDSLNRAMMNSMRQQMRPGGALYSTGMRSG